MSTRSDTRLTMRYRPSISSTPSVSQPMSLLRSSLSVTRPRTPNLVVSSTSSTSSSTSRTRPRCSLPASASVSQASPTSLSLPRTSSSYITLKSLCTDTCSRSLCNAYGQLGARGVSILFASGDGGVSGPQSSNACNGKAFVPTFPSGCPLYVTTSKFPAWGVR